MRSDPLGSHVGGSYSGNHRVIGPMGIRPLNDGCRGLGGYSITPCRRIEAIEQVQDFAVVQCHGLQAAETEAVLITVNDPVSKAMVLPVLVPPVVEVLRLGPRGEHVGGVALAGPYVGVDGVDQVDVGRGGAPQTQPCGR